MIARTGKTFDFRPRLVLGYADSAHAALCARHFRRQGWEVHQVPSGQEARRLASILGPQVVILDTDLADESGWLTTAKILVERPHQKILLVGPGRPVKSEAFAAFLGAAGYVSREEGPEALTNEILGALTVVSA